MNTHLVRNGYSDFIIGTYFDLGGAALEKGEFKIAEKMYQAALNEPSANRGDRKFVYPLLLNLARTREGLRQHYKAKMIYIRALAHYKRYYAKADEEVVRVLLILARVNAKQGLYKQAREFVDSARQTCKTTPGAGTAAMVPLVEEVLCLLEQRGRDDEVQLVQGFREELQVASLVESFAPVP